MPYTPLRDSLLLHNLIINPDLLLLSFAEVIEKSGDEDLEVGRMQNVEEDDSEIEADILNAREGVLTPQNIGLDIRFNVVSYGLLWSKAAQCCTYSFLNDTFSNVLSSLTLCEQHLYHPTQALIGSLQNAQEEARLMLVFAMYLNDRNSHDVIRSFFLGMHDEAYQDCVHCASNLHEEERLDSPDTMLRLYDALYNMGLHQYINTSIHDAEVNLMHSEGQLEGYSFQFNAMRRFENCKRTS